MQHSKKLGRQGDNGKNDTRDIAARPVEACDQANSDRIGSDDEYDGRRRGCRFARLRRISAGPYDRRHLPTNAISRQSLYPILLIVSPVILDPDVFALNESRVIQALPESIDNKREAGSRCASEEPDHRHRWLLRARSERPSSRRATEQRDEFTPLHSITSSARSRNGSGIVSPSAFAVVRLMMRSNFVGCSTGMSLGFVPRRILSTNSAARRHTP